MSLLFNLKVININQSQFRQSTLSYINLTFVLDINLSMMAFTITSSGTNIKDIKEASKPRNQFSEFCEEITLNGWYYLAKQSIGILGRIY